MIEPKLPTFNHSVLRDFEAKVEKSDFWLLVFEAKVDNVTTDYFVLGLKSESVRFLI